MDIYFGSNQPIPEKYKREFSQFTVLNEHHLCDNSEFLCELKQKNGESLVINNENLEIIFDGYLTGLRGSDLESKVLKLAKLIVSKSTFDPVNFNGIFNICVREKISGDIWLSSDSSALLPLYYNQISNSFYYCSHGHIMATVLASEPDYAGICQKQIFGYTLGSRTYYKGINRINPGETVKFESETGKVYSTYKSVYYTGEYSKAISESEIYHSLLSSFESIKNSYETVGLMLSEGFDSRFMGGIAQQAGFRIESFTHGIRGSIGQVIAEKVAKEIKSNHHFAHLNDGFPLEKGQLSAQLLLSDNLNIPFWIYGTEYFKKQNAVYPIIVGTALDTTLGGHAYYKPSRPPYPAVKQRYSEIIKQVLGLINANYIETLSIILLNTFFINDLKRIEKSIFDSYNTDIATNIFNEAKNLNDQISEELNRLRITGSGLSSQVLERFFLENRVRKFSFGQELTIRAYNKIFIPSYEYSFMSLASSINPIMRLHHKLYLSVLNKFTPKLLRIQNGTYGLPATYPRLVLETSRFIHKKLEMKNFHKLLASRGDLSPAKFRSALVTDFCVRDNQKMCDFENIVEKNNAIFNTSGMNSYFNKVQDYKIRTFTHDKFYRGLEVSQIIQHHI